MNHAARTTPNDLRDTIDVESIAVPAYSVLRGQAPVEETLAERQRHPPDVS